MDIRTRWKALREGASKHSLILREKARAGYARWKEGWAGFGASLHVTPRQKKRLLWLLITGFVLGAGAKAWASNHFLIGAEDYALSDPKTLYQWNAKEARPTSSGPACSEETGDSLQQ